MDGVKAKPRASRLVYVAVAVAVVVAVVVVLYYVNPGGTQVVAVGDNVSVYYTGTFTNGTVFDTNTGQTPLNFVVGSGQMISGFDQAVVGMKIGESKNVTLTPAEAYGEINNSLILSVPISVFNLSSNQTLNVGETVFHGTSRGVITSVNSTNVTVDFNPPLAGYTLRFIIQVVGINK